MVSELVAGRPSGLDIVPAHRRDTTLVRRLGDEGDPGAPTIWRSEGLSNTYLFATPEGRVAVNTGMGFEGPVHRAAYDAVTSGPITHVVFTQGHVDHVGGTDTFSSTTELYGVPSSRIHADLVAVAGGPEPLVGRARAPLDAGRPIEAIHLLEPVLSVHPDHAGGRQLEIDAHRALLDAGGDANLWSNGWLRHRIAAAEAALGS